MKEERPSLIKLINYLSRYTQSYTDEALDRFQLTSGTYPFLLMLFHNEGINQNQISRELNVDKAMSARSIKKLIELGYIKKEEDVEDSRAYKLYLTDKSRDIIPEIKYEINRWLDIISAGVDEKDRNRVVDILGKILNNAKNIK